MNKLNIAEMRLRWRNLPFRIQLGFVLVVLAQPFIALILLVPFLELDLPAKGMLSLGLFVIGEILFYSGLFLLGKELVAKWRKYFTSMGWRKKNESDEDGRR